MGGLVERGTSGLISTSAYAALLLHIGEASGD